MNTHGFNLDIEEGFFQLQRKMRDLTIAGKEWMVYYDPETKVAKLIWNDPK